MKQRSFIYSIFTYFTDFYCLEAWGVGPSLAKRYGGATAVECGDFIGFTAQYS